MSEYLDIAERLERYIRWGNTDPAHGRELADESLDAIRELVGRVGELEKQRENMPSELLGAFRGVETPCPSCGGWGVRAYGTTATWRGGAGGATITAGACDKCWGSGDADRRWPSHREAASLAARVARYESEKDPYAPHNKQQLDDMAEHIQALSSRNAELEAEVGRLQNLLDFFETRKPPYGVLADDNDRLRNLLRDAMLEMDDSLTRQAIRQALEQSR